MHRLLIYTDMVTIDLYSYTGHPDTVNKVLVSPTQVAGALRQDVDILHPVFKLKQSPMPRYNYCYVQALGRYYFIDRVEYVGNNTYEISCTVDVLKTYEDAILEATATVLESDTPLPYISTRRNVYDRQPNIEKVVFPNTGLFNENGSIVMVTIKGRTKNG